MATIRGPRIVTNGLILALDAADKKSYPGSGTSWFDISGNNRVGTLSTANYSPGQGVPSFDSTYGGRFYFNGYSGQYVDTNLTVANFNVNTGDFTMDAWAYITDPGLGPQKILYYIGNTNVYSPNGANASTWYTQDTGFVFRNLTDNVNGNRITLSLTLNNFYNIVYVRSGSTFYAYVNGTSRGSTTYTNPGINSAAKFTLGASMNAYSDLFTGYIYSCKNYNRALSATEVLQNYTVTKTRLGL